MPSGTASAKSATPSTLLSVINFMKDGHPDYMAITPFMDVSRMSGTLESV